MLSKTRTTIIALVAAFSFAPTMAPAAQAIPAKGGNVPSVEPSGPTTAEVTAGATGQGVDQATCDKYAALINAYHNRVGNKIDDGRMEEAGEAHQMEEQYTEDALDAGCFIVY